MSTCSNILKRAVKLVATVSAKSVSDTYTLDSYFFGSNNCLFDFIEDSKMDSFSAFDPREESDEER